MAGRLAGHQGYTLLLALIKKCQPFLYVNAATYASFSTHLLHAHASCSFYHKRAKETLFSIPYQGGKSNIPLDEFRELEHREATNAFRPRSTQESVAPRLAALDSYKSVPASTPQVDDRPIAEALGLLFKAKDLSYLNRGTPMLIRSGGLDLKDDLRVMNVYDEIPYCLPLCIVDEQSFPAGYYLCLRNACQKYGEIY